MIIHSALFRFRIVPSDYYYKSYTEYDMLIIDNLQSFNMVWLLYPKSIISLMR